MKGHYATNKSKTPIDRRLFPINNSFRYQLYQLLPGDKLDSRPTTGHVSTSFSWNPQPEDPRTSRAIEKWGFGSRKYGFAWYV